MKVEAAEYRDEQHKARADKRIHRRYFIKIKIDKYLDACGLKKHNMLAVERRKATEKPVYHEDGKT
jgi:hypothetical protein